MSTAHERSPLASGVRPLSRDRSPRAPLAWLGRQLLLVPEAVILSLLRALYTILGPSALLTVVGLMVVLYFTARMILLAQARQAAATTDYERADRLARSAARLHPASADALALLGASHLARGEAAPAVRTLARAVALFPQHPSLHVTLSAALLDAGQPQQARESAQHALALDARSAAALLHLAVAEAQLGADPAHVEELLREGLGLPAAPAETAALHCALAQLLIREERAAEARLALRGAERLVDTCPIPQRARLHYQLGELLSLCGDAEGAMAHFSAGEAGPSRRPATTPA